PRSRRSASSRSSRRRAPRRRSAPRPPPRPRPRAARPRRPEPAGLALSARLGVAMTANAMDERRRIVVGVVAGAHGVRGEIKIKSFAQNPRAIASYGPLGDRTGARSFRLKLRGAVRGLLIARIDGVEDRDQAEALKGLELTVARDVLPRAKRDEWYLADLV